MIKKRTWIRNSWDEQGFTLIELMITMLISGLIMAAIYMAYLSQQKTYNAQRQVVTMQQNIRAVMEILTSEVRMAGYDPTGDSNASLLNGTNFRQITFTQDLDGDGTIAAALETITYALGGVDANTDGVVDNIDIDSNGQTDAVNTITRDVGVGGAQVIAENIQAIEFLYTLIDDAQVLNPTASQLSDIKSVQVTILAVGGISDRKFTNSMVYYPGSNPNGDPLGTKWGPFNDNFRRRILTYNINCRNMGLN